MEVPKHVLFCANPDLNYIDGSSIWAQTFALALAAAGARVRLIAKSRPERDELWAPVSKNSSIDVVDGTSPGHWRGKRFPRLNGQQMAKLAVALDQQLPCQVLIVRGLDIASELVAHPELLSRTWLYLTDIPQDVAAYSPELRQIIAALAWGCGLLLCQSGGFAALWQQLVPELDMTKVRIYSPVIPDIPTDLPDLAARPKRAIYAGKFKSEWMTLDMAREWPRASHSVPGSELVMIGDKIHNEPEAPKFQQDMREALTTTTGLRWLGAMSREHVQNELRSARVGLSWRAPSMDQTVEYSTKILEYGGAGCAAILNRNPLHEALLGSDYPLYANTALEFRQAVIKAFDSEGALRTAADRLRKLAAQHTFSRRVEDIRTWLSSINSVNGSNLNCAQNGEAKRTVLVAGHDLKFFRPLQAALEATGRYTFLVDEWKGHAKHDEQKSASLLERADVIFCEWCLGNIEWYSQRKLPRQRLVARFHLQERDLPYLGRANWDNISHIAYVSDGLRDSARSRVPFPIERTSVIANFVDQKKFQPLKKLGEAGFTLGMIGIVPARKRLDRAIDLLEALLTRDKRFCLRIKGPNPSSYPWLLKRFEEKAYYEKIFSRINESDLLRNRVIFDPPGDDINNWLRYVGYVISPSDYESFHMAVGEGMASGCVPVVWNWAGSDRIWPKRYIVSSVGEAVEIIRSSKPSPDISSFILENYSENVIIPQWLRVLDDEESKMLGGAFTTV